MEKVEGREDTQKTWQDALQSDEQELEIKLNELAVRKVH